MLSYYIPAERRFSDYRECQLSVTATNLTRKCGHIFDFNSEVPVVEAVLASMAYPVAVFLPHTQDWRRLLCRWRGTE